MLNTFPDLLSFGLLAPFLLRLVVGFFFLAAGAALFKKERARGPHLPSMSSGFSFSLLVACFQILLGALLIVGLYTQLAALGLLLFIISGRFSPRIQPFLPEHPLVGALLSVILVSLLFSGAGAFAFDLPF